MPKKNAPARKSGAADVSRTYAESGDGAAGEDLRESLYQELTADETPAYRIRVEEAPVSVHSFLPDYRYRFEGSNADRGDRFVDAFTEFLIVNEYLALDGDPTQAFADGFARAVAMTALFMDSMELTAAQAAGREQK